MTEHSQLDTQLSQMRADVLSGKMSRRAALKAAGAAAAVATLAAKGISSVGAQDATPAAGGDDVVQTFYQRGYTINPTSFDFNANLYCNGDTNAFEGVLTFDADLNPAPGWAETWESNEDASVWTFHIRQNNTGWSDGKPVTAQDFVYSWTRQLKPETAAPYASFFFDVKNAEAFNTGAEGVSAEDLGLKAIDDWTLEVTCEGPRGGFPLKTAYAAAWPAPQWAVEEYGELEWALGDVPLVSNGPFNLVNLEPDVKWSMTRNEGFWDAENIQIDNYVAPIYPSANQMLLFESGSGDQQLDWAILPGADYLRYLEDPELATTMNPYVYPGIWMLLPSNGQPPFDKLEVLKAVSHAIDRDRLRHRHQWSRRDGLLHGSAGSLRLPGRSVVAGYPGVRSRARDEFTRWNRIRGWQELARDHDVDAR